MKLFFINKKAVCAFFAFAAALSISLAFCAGSAKTSKSGRKVPIYRVKTEKKAVAVTFDSAWDDSDLDEILPALKQYECRATFFTVGTFVDKYPERIKEMHENGNEIANHTDTHPHPNKLTEKELLDEIENCDKKIKAITGQKEVLFRAPYGEYNDTLVNVCENSGRFCIQWDVDSLDWKGLTPNEMENRILSKVQNGSIILLHNGAKHTAKALPSILCELKNRGFEFVTVSELIYKQNFQIDPSGTQIPK